MKQHIKNKARELYSKGFSTRKVAKKLDIGNATVYRWCKDIIRKNSEIDRCGKNHPNYKGGYTSKEGYRIICVEGVYYKEHVYLIQQRIERELNDNEVVHHKNGIKNDNRVENLQIMTRSEHTILHNKERNVEVS